MVTKRISYFDGTACTFMISKSRFQSNFINNKQKSELENSTNLKFLTFKLLSVKAIFFRLRGLNIENIL
jgi:hypothetical protein